MCWNSTVTVVVVVVVVVVEEYLYGTIKTIGIQARVSEAAATP